ncbi:response regulator transcription factor [Candidatus Sumerlaeota bacterium]|nr:response regulator transcription factor [Candidatus Sumerlaeota bacterium]
MRILLVEDETRLARNIKKGIESLPSFVVDVCNDGIDGQHQALTTAYDLIILDIMLPGVDGMTILQAIRSAGLPVPVLILSARTSKDDVVQGLNFGSDDYLGKPFDMGELLARVKALIRRSHNKPDPVIRVGDLEIDTQRHVVRRGGRELLLPALEYRLLEYLAFRADQVVSKSDLLEHLYDYNWEKFSNVIEVYVSTLRRKLEKENLPKVIHTIRGQGYMLSMKPLEGSAG